MAMSIPQNYFRTMFSKLKINQTHGGVAYSINLERFGKRLDIAQDALDAQVWATMKQYMPFDNGNLIRQTEELNQSTRGEVYLYDPNVDYGHYVYEGALYVDPTYNVGAFYAPGYGYWSRPGVPKVKSERELEYQTTHNPLATAHWGEVAYRNHKREWVDTAKRAFRG